MFSFTLFYADCIEQPKNCLYTHKAIICDIASFIEAVSHDYVGSQFKDYKRNNDNFISADCIIMDCDNNHSDNSEDWVTHEDVAKAFPDVAFAVHYSRNHMKLKGDKSPRPKFHVCFPIETITDAQHFSFVAQYIICLFPFFDKSVKDAGRMFFGTPNPQVAFVEGNTKLDDFIRSRSLDYPNDDNAIVSNQSSEACSDIIPEGQRNSTLYQYACKILVRFGENDNSHDNFLKEAQLCSPPLPQNELNTIWSNAVKFYNGQILNRNDYIPPNLYGCYSLKPSDFTDIGQANVFVCKYGEIIKYSPATDFLVFNGSFWEEDNQHARALAQELTEKQLNEAETKIKMAEREILRMQKSSFPGDTQNERQLKALKEEYADAIIFKDYALKRRNSQRISATIPAQNDIKNFSDYLCKNAGGAILSWIIEGAQKIITNEFKLETPEAVLKATGKYKADNDWLDRFLSECCEIGNSFCVKSSEFLAAFKVFNEQTGENSKTASTIRAAMTAKGFTYKQTRNGIIVHGLRLRNS